MRARRITSVQLVMGSEGAQRAHPNTHNSEDLGNVGHFSRGIVVHASMEYIIKAREQNMHACMEGTECGCERHMQST